MLDLYKLQIFRTVVEAGSFSAAGERLYMTQSAVSQHIHDLEGSLGATLFQRGWRGVTLTPAGETLDDYARRIFALVSEAENAVMDVAQLRGGQVMVGATPGVSVYLLPEWSTAFRSRYPALTVSIQTGVTGQIVADILARRLDIGLIEGELDEGYSARLGYIGLGTAEQFVVVGRRHPWWGRDRMPASALDGQTFIMRPRNSQSRVWLDTQLARLGVQPVINAEFDNLESIKRAVSAGLCLTILPEYVVRHEESLGVLWRLRLDDAPLERELKLVWNAGSPLPPVARAFTQHLAEQFPALHDLT
jgi:DNA-binding transcriptional LysR family regulator